MEPTSRISPWTEGDAAALSSLLRDLGLPETLCSPLLAHAAAVCRHADRLGLVSQGDLASIVRRHTCDSLLFALARTPKPDEMWADVGSGAGFPGQVLACCYPDTHFTLVEPTRRRAAFLDLQVTGLGLANATVCERRLEELSERFDVVVARAFATPEEAFRRLEPFIRSGGQAVVAVSHAARLPAACVEKDVRRPQVDSPGRFFIMTRT